MGLLEQNAENETFNEPKVLCVQTDFYATQL